MKWFAALVLCLLPIPLNAQQASPLPPLNLLLDRLYAYAAQYRATLPSLSCEESIVSQALKKGKVGWQVTAEGTMRELRTENPDDPFLEQHQFRTVDGKEAPKGGVSLPYLIQGGFANLIGFHFEARRDCYDYRISSLGGGLVQLEFGLKADSDNAECGKILPGMHWLVRADAKTGHILHSERQISAEASKRHGEAYFASLDYAPRQLGDRTFWLPTHFYAHDAGDDRRMYATYSDCHRYAGEMEILPGIAPVGPAPDFAPGPGAGLGSDSASEPHSSNFPVPIQ